jgi:Tol biopolymer transport system component
MATKASRWTRANDVFHRAILLAEGQQFAFVARECGDDTGLLAEVESLVRAHRDGTLISRGPALSAGTRLGAYDIVGFIAAGGMGEVYRARDTRLKRDVAMKILPESVASDPDRLARFQREAEVLAALNHLNIAGIYGVEESNGTRALVMEFVEGPTLADRIAQGAIPLDESIQIAKQIAQALEAAHEQGIIHRDLKPANIKVRPDGTVKVLDFGLAKAMEPKGATSASASMPPTITTPAMTQAGMILGTASYMSPEQTRGKTVDKHADIWAFGCVLFEMLTGQNAFVGAEMPDVLAAVQATEPDWTRLPPALSPGLATFLRRCLQKDTRQRVQAIGDVRLALEGAFETTAPQMTEAAATAPAPGRGWLAWMPFATALLAAAVFAISAARYLREAPEPPAPETRVEINTPATDDPISFAVSPDGHWLVFVASSDGVSRLWLRALASTTSDPMIGTEGAAYPFWSPDSRSVGFFADGKLTRFDIGSGAPQTLAAASAPRGGAWNADGVILVTSAAGGPLVRVPASGGVGVAVTKPGGQTKYLFPSFLPDGRRFLFLAEGPPEASGIYLGSLDSIETWRITRADTAGTYLPSGYLLWVRAGVLVAQHLDLDRKALTGDLTTLAENVAVSDGAGAVSASAAGLVAYRADVGVRTQLTWFDRAGKALGVVEALGVIGAPPDGSAVRISPDGRHVVLNRTIQGNVDVWSLDWTRSSRFTSDAARDRDPIWSPDGRRVVFNSNRKGHFDLYQKSFSGADREEVLLDSPQDKIAHDWSPDGRFILYDSIDPQSGDDIWVLPMEGDRKPWPFVQTDFAERYAQFSSDGRWVAYASNESGRFEIYVRPFIESSVSGVNRDRADGRWQVSTAGGVFPRWRRNGEELYYIGSGGQMMAVPITINGATLEAGTPHALFQTRIVGAGSDTGPTYYDVTRDDRFLIAEIPHEAVASPITLLQNWHPQLKK